MIRTARTALAALALAGTLAACGSTDHPAPVASDLTAPEQAYLADLHAHLSEGAWDGGLHQIALLDSGHLVCAAYREGGDDAGVLAALAHGGGPFTMADDAAIRDDAVARLCPLARG